MITNIHLASAMIPRFVNTESIFSFTYFGAHWAEVSLSGHVVDFNVVSEVGLVLGGELTVCAAPVVGHRVLRYLCIDRGCNLRFNKLFLKRF